MTEDVWEKFSRPSSIKTCVAMSRISVRYLEAIQLAETTASANSDKADCRRRTVSALCAAISISISILIHLTNLKTLPNSGDGGIYHCPHG